MNQYEMVVLIVLVVTVAGVFRAKYKFQAQTPVDNQDSQRMREEIRTLKERIQVLERIATDKESALEREIEQLRDR
jgi:mRNA-degrading endonuclease toxin of MazEF toxin-antitoxin module